MLTLDLDLEAGYHHLLNRYSFIDKNRTVALGMSFGGYMVSTRLYWLKSG
jgi:dipeptidyl aminopeptidase/acylaminoacyl peptidase